MTDQERRAGTVRYWDEDYKRWREATPGSLYFSTVTMLATEWWDGKEWKKIYEEGEGDAAD